MSECRTAAKLVEVSERARERVRMKDEGYAHRKNVDGTFASICLSGFLKVMTANIESELREAETQHSCQVRDVLDDPLGSHSDESHRPNRIFLSRKAVRADSESLKGNVIFYRLEHLNGRRAAALSFLRAYDPEWLLLSARRPRGSTWLRGGYETHRWTF